MTMNDTTVCTAHSGLLSDIEQIKASDAKQWLAIEKLQNRLPVWATAVISVLTFLLGAAVTYGIKLSGPGV